MFRVMAKENPYFCILPWIHLEIQQGGNCTTCCKTQLKINLGNLKERNLYEISNDLIQREVRLNMLQGKPTSACKDCYADEKIGNVSLRQKSNRYYNDYFNLTNSVTREDGSLSQFNLIYAGLRFSNICNLSCVYCNSQYSTSIKDDLNTGILKTFRSDSELEQFLDDYCQKVETYYIAGGEPFLDSFHDKFLDYLIKKNRTNVRLTYNTNLSIPLEKKMELFTKWKKFKDVFVCASLDSQTLNGEQIRRGLRWSIAEDNIRLIIKKLGLKKIIINPTVTALNAPELCSFIRYLLEKELMSPDCLMFNFLEFPGEYSVHALPDKAIPPIFREIILLKKDLLIAYDLQVAYPLIVQLNSLCTKLHNISHEKITNN